MANFSESANWENAVYKLAVTDQLLGGDDGPLNTAVGQLTNRTRYLYEQITSGAEDNVVNVLSYGAVGDGTTDDTDAIHDAAAEVPTGGTLFFPGGYNFATASSVILQRSINIIMDSPITSTRSSSNHAATLTIGESGSGNSGRILQLRVGRTTQSNWSDSPEVWRPSRAYSTNAVVKNGFHRYTCTSGGTSATYGGPTGTGSSITDGSVTWDYTDDTVESDIGILIHNAQSCDINVMSVTNHSIGVRCVGSGAKGFVYNTIRLGYIIGNRIGVDVSDIGSGWCNENLFLGGRFAVFSGNASRSRYGIRVTSLDGLYTVDTGSVGNNNNNFIKPSFELQEDDCTGTAQAIGILFESGASNTVAYARNESNHYAVEWRNACRNNRVQLGYGSATEVDLASTCNNWVYSGDPTGTIPVFDIQDIGAGNSCPYSASTAFIPGMSWITSSSGGAATPTKTGSSMGTYIFLGGKAWASSTAYDVDNVVQNDSGKLYVCIDGGNSAASGGPTGTSDSIVDNGCIWKYVGPANVVTVTGNRGFGVMIDTNSQKKFLVTRECPSGDGGRVTVVCYDAAGNVLTGSSPKYVKDDGATTFSQSGVSNSSYRQGADSSGSVVFGVRDEVKRIWVGILGGTETANIRSFTVHARTSSRCVGARASFAFKSDRNRLVATQAPASGTWEVGDVVWNDAVEAGSAPGWMCVEAGTPGTWVDMAPLSL